MGSSFSSIPMNSAVLCRDKDMSKWVRPCSWYNPSQQLEPSACHTTTTRGTGEFQSPDGRDPVPGNTLAQTRSAPRAMVSSVSSTPRIYAHSTDPDSNGPGVRSLQVETLHK